MPDPLRIVCAWCRAILQPGPLGDATPPDQLSHGCCPQCAVTLVPPPAIVLPGASSRSLDYTSVTPETIARAKASRDAERRELERLTGCTITEAGIVILLQ